MEKMVSFPEKRVRDLSGLLLTLKKAGYAVRNVGADELGTYIYLEEAEEKDPAAVIDEWTEKPAPKATDQKSFAVRKAEVKKAQEAEAKKAQEAAAAAKATEEAARVAAAAAEKAAAEVEAQAIALEASGDPVLASPVEEPEAPAPATAEQKPSLVKRFLRSLW